MMNLAWQLAYKILIKIEHCQLITLSMTKNQEVNSSFIYTFLKPTNFILKFVIKFKHSQVECTF